MIVGIRRDLAAFDKLHKHAANVFVIEMGKRTELFCCFQKGFGLYRVYAAGSHRVKTVDNRDDLSFDRDFIALEPSGIAASVQPLVVAFGDFCYALTKTGLEQFCAVCGMALDDVVFFIGQAAFFLKNFIRYIAFSDVVEQGSGCKRVYCALFTG